MRSLLILITFCASSVSFAGDKHDNDRQVVYKQKTEIDFEGVEIQGQLVKPMGSLLLDRRRANFNPLIKLRVDFDSEMAASVDEIK